MTLAASAARGSPGPALSGACRRHPSAASTSSRACGADDPHASSASRALNARVAAASPSSCDPRLSEGAIRDSACPDNGVLKSTAHPICLAGAQRADEARGRALFISSGHQGTLGGWVAQPLGRRSTRSATSGVRGERDGGFMFNVQELATAVAAPDSHRGGSCSTTAPYGNVATCRRKYHGNAGDRRDPRQAVFPCGWPKLRPSRGQPGGEPEAVRSA